MDATRGADDLTGLPTRSATTNWLTEHSGEQVAVLDLDLGGLGAVNISFGAEEGDATLRRVTGLLSAAAADGDWVARLGGDEFIVARAGADLPDAVALAADIRARFRRERWGPEASPVPLTCRIGIATGTDGPQLLQHAATALARAKASGHTETYEPAMAQSAAAHTQFLARFARGLESGALELHYQPQCTGEGDLVGAEAVVRWRDGDRLVSPDVFIPAIEESRLIDRLGDWVLNAAATQVQEWRSAGLTPPTVAVNLSPRQFADLEANVAATFAGVLAAHDLSPGDLEVELTESAVMPAPGEVDPEVAGLLALGVPLVLDDFGTGYSALASVTRLPISKIKIDRSLVADLSAESRSRVIVEATLWIAARLGIRCVAEGVETALQRDILLAAGCTEFQGYLFSAPLPAGEFADRWLAS